MPRIVLLAGRESPYLQFHVRQAMKLEVAATLGGFVSLAATFLFGILLLPFVGLLISAVLLVLPLVLKVICFFQICQGRAVEPAVIRNLKFMR